MINKAIGLKVLILPFSIALVIMITVFFARPLYVEVNDLKKSSEENKNKLSQLEAQEKAMNELENSFNAMEERGVVTAALPEKEEIDNYLSEFYGRVSRSGILLKSFLKSEETVEFSDTYSCGKEQLVDSQASGASAAAPASGASTAAPAAGGGSPGAPALGTGGANPGIGDITAQQAMPLASTSQPACAKNTIVNITASGNWDQVINFFKFIEDTSRIANIRNVSLGNEQSTSQESSGDAISISASISIFNKPKNGIISPALISSLASKKGFDKAIINKIESAIYGSFEVPKVEKVGTRNLFK
jgi:Tfp pilus assembly protein PilO